MCPRRVRSRAATGRLIPPAGTKESLSPLLRTALSAIPLTAVTRGTQSLLDAAAPALKEAISLHSPKKRRLFAPVNRDVLSCARTHRCMRLRRLPGPQLFLLTGLPPVASRGPIPVRATRDAPLITIGDLHRLAAVSDDR